MSNPDTKCMGGNFIRLGVAGADETLRIMDEVFTKAHELQVLLGELSKQIAEINLTSAWTDPPESQITEDERP